MRRTFLNAVAVAACLTVLVSAPGCGGEHAEAKRIVRQALAAVEYPGDSRIQFLERELEPGMIIKVWDGVAARAGTLKPFTVLERGYLVYIDEYPACDFFHPVKFLFVPGARPTQPVVLLSGDAFPSSDIADKSGKPIEQTWVEY